MYQQKSILTITGIVIEALFLAFVAFCFADYVLFLIRTGQLPAFRYIANALIVFAPGIFLIWAYNEYRTGSFTAFDNIARCGVVNAVLDALPFVPMVGTGVFGVSFVTGMRNFGLRFLDFAFPPNGTLLLYLFAFIVQTVVPIAIIGILEGKEYLQAHGLKEAGMVPLQIVGTLLMIWLGIQMTRGIMASGIFEHSVILIGFFPIPGQVFGFLIPIAVAIGGIVVIWTKPWEQ